MNPAKALALNRLGEKDCVRLEQFLVTARSMAPQVAVDPMPSMGGDAKRARIGGSDSAYRATWTPKCKAMLDRIGSSFGINKKVFWVPVDPKILPDYYTVIKNPMFFNTIEERLKTGKYETPFHFYNDVTLSLSNCQMYNPINDPFRKMGDSADTMFKKMWTQANFSEGGAGGGGAEDDDVRGKRNAAVVARQKFEAEPQTNVGPKKGGRGEVTSGGRQPKDQPVSDTRKAEMGELLQSEEMGNHMEDLMALLPPELLEGADGEFELDFESLDDATIRKIDVFLCNIFGPPAGAAAAAAGKKKQPGSPDDASMQDDDEDVSEGDLDDESDDD